MKGLKIYAVSADKSRKTIVFCRLQVMVRASWVFYTHIKYVENEGFVAKQTLYICV